MTQSPEKLKIILSDVNINMIQAWRKIFDSDSSLDVEIYPGSIFDLSVDALVSPANSYGFMDGGLDGLISLFFGWKVQEHLQKIIESKHDGELLVGLAEIIPTNNLSIPYVISAPTMRVPMKLAKDSVNPYLATRATLREIKKVDYIKSVVFPGLGTGVGDIDYDICAKQMHKAIREFFYPKDFPSTWFKAQLEHQYLYTNMVRDLQK